MRYTSPPLEHDLTIAGDVMLVLNASTDVRDTEWFVYVADVDSSGQSVRLTTGALRARFRDVEYDIGLRSIANTFKKGHRIRVAIMNALDVYAFPNSNTGKNDARVTEAVVGKMAMHHGAGQASHLVLPVLPRVAP